MYSYITFCIDPFLTMSARLKISCALRRKVDRGGQIFGSGNKCRLLLNQWLIWPPWSHVLLRKQGLKEGQGPWSFSLPVE